MNYIFIILNLFYLFYHCQNNTSNLTSNYNGTVQLFRTFADGFLGQQAYLIYSVNITNNELPSLTYTNGLIGGLPASSISLFKNSTIRSNATILTGPQPLLTLTFGIFGFYEWSTSSNVSLTGSDAPLSKLQLSQSALNEWSLISISDEGKLKDLDPVNDRISIKRISREFKNSNNSPPIYFTSFVSNQNATSLPMNQLKSDNYLNASYGRNASIYLTYSSIASYISIEQFPFKNNSSSLYILTGLILPNDTIVDGNLNLINTRGNSSEVLGSLNWSQTTSDGSKVTLENAGNFTVQDLVNSKLMQTTTGTLFEIIVKEYQQVQMVWFKIENTPGKSLAWNTTLSLDVDAILQRPPPSTNNSNMLISISISLFSLLILPILNL